MEKYLKMVIKRKWWIIITFLVAVLGGTAHLLTTPKLYEAETLILVQSQRVPEDFVRSIVSSTVEDRLRTISQQVTSRTNLERIISQFYLYQEGDKTIQMDGKVAQLRRMITINVGGGAGGRRGTDASSFTIRFQGENPRTVMEVTNALASNFISENLKIREAQALGTSDFLTDELALVEARLQGKEEELKEYRESFMGGLPEQLQTNLSILERLQNQHAQYTGNLRDSESRRDSILRDIAATGEAAVSLSNGRQGSRTRDVNDPASLRSELANLRSRYTENHPDIIRLKGIIERMEEERAQALADSGLEGSDIPASIKTVDQTLRRQLQAVEQDIARLRAEINETRVQIATYQRRVEETPKREQELVELNRDYSNLRQLYNSLLTRKLEADMAVSMERKQKGEQFRVIDPAKIPSRPVKPDARKILLMTLALGLGVGVGIAYLFEYMDSSYKTPEEAEGDLGIPVLASIPFLRTENELSAIRRREILTGVCVSVGFIVSLLGIIITIKGFDTTMGYVRGLF